MYLTVGILVGICRFNGASLFRVRKPILCARCGADARRLQWSLTLSSEETWTCPCNRSPRCSFNGASLFRVRKPDRSLSIPSATGLLQWSLTLSSEETEVVPLAGAGASRLQWSLTLSSEETGPRAWAQGDVADSFNGASLFRVRKRRPRLISRRWMACFNGASLFRVRKPS